LFGDVFSAEDSKGFIFVTTSVASFCSDFLLLFSNSYFLLLFSSFSSGFLSEIFTSITINH